MCLCCLLRDELIIRLKPKLKGGGRYNIESDALGILL